MKAFEHVLLQRGLALGAMFSLAGLCLATEVPTETKQQPLAKSKLGVTAKKKTGKQEEAKFVEVTGSRLQYKVKPGEQSPATTLKVTVIDPKAAQNQGYSSPMEMLLRNTAVSPGWGR
jgi:hypothetical protein